MNRVTKKRRRLSYEGKITWLTFLAVAPAVVVALALLWFGDHPPKVQWTLTILIVGCLTAFIWSTREHAVRPLQTLSNLLAALAIPTVKEKFAIARTRSPARETRALPNHKPYCCRRR